MLTNYCINGNLRNDFKHEIIMEEVKIDELVIIWSWFYFKHCIFNILIGMLMRPRIGLMRKMKLWTATITDMIWPVCRLYSESTMPWSEICRLSEKRFATWMSQPSVWCKLTLIRLNRFMNISGTLMSSGTH